MFTQREFRIARHGLEGRDPRRRLYTPNLKIMSILGLVFFLRPSFPSPLPINHSACHSLKRLPEQKKTIHLFSPKLKLAVDPQPKSKKQKGVDRKRKHE